MTWHAEVAGVLVPDVIRVLTVVLTVVMMGGIAAPITGRTPGAWRVWLLLVAIWVYMARGALASVANLGNPHMPWYTTPLTCAGAVVGVVYLAVYYRDVRRGQQLAAKVAGLHPD